MNHFDYRNGVLHAEAVLPNQIRIAGVCCGPTLSPRLYLTDGALIGLILLPQTRSPMLRNLAWSPVIYEPPFIQTAPKSSRQARKLFASAGEDSRSLR